MASRISVSGSVHDHAMAEPWGWSAAEFQDLLVRRREIDARLARLAMGATAAMLQSVLPAATSAVVFGAMNDDGALVLRIRRVLDADGGVLFDVTVGAEREIEDVIDEVNVEYLDVLLDLTGDRYMGEHVLTLE
jgi:hypothetical protein